MKILVINCGSSSVKYQLIETSLPQINSNTDRYLAKGEVDRVRSSEALLSFEVAGSRPGHPGSSREADLFTRACR